MSSHCCQNLADQKQPTSKRQWVFSMYSPREAVQHSFFLCISLWLQGIRGESAPVLQGPLFTCCSLHHLFTIPIELCYSCCSLKSLHVATPLFSNANSLLIKAHISMCCELKNCCTTKVVSTLMAAVRIAVASDQLGTSPRASSEQILHENLVVQLLQLCYGIVPAMQQEDRFESGNR